MEGVGEAEADAEPEAEPELEPVDEPVDLEEPALETAVMKPEPVEVELLPVVVADESEVEVSANIQSQLPRSDTMYMYNVDHHPVGCHGPLPTV